MPGNDMMDVPDMDVPGSDIFDFLDSTSQPGLMIDPLGAAPSAGREGAIQLSGEDLRRFTFRLDQSLNRAITKMGPIHEAARYDRDVYRTRFREQEYEGQPNLTTPLSKNKADGLYAHVVDAIDQKPLGTFSPEGIGRPAERAAQVAPLAAAYLEREINRGGSREALVRSMNKEAIIVGTGIGKLAMVQHPSGEWFVKVAQVIPLEHFYVDRIAVTNLKHVFSAYEDRKPFYQLEEMADQGLLDREAVERLRDLHSAEFTPTAGEEESDFREESHAFQEETTIHKIYTCYMRYRPEGSRETKIWEAVWSDQYKMLLAVRENPVSEAFDHPPIALHRVDKDPNNLLGRSVMRRLEAIQEMADNAINSHLALNNLAASPPFVYKEHSPFGRLMESKRRIVPGIGIPSRSGPDANDVQTLDIRNPGLSLQDLGVAQQFADRATFTEEAIGTSSDSRKTLGQFRVEMQRGTMRVRLDLGDLAYDASQTLSMIWSMMLKYKVEPAGIVEVEDGGRFLAAREISEQDIERKMDSLVMPLIASGEVTADELMELETEFNSRLTDGVIPSARRSDLTIALTGTKIVADKATELEMLKELTPFILQGLPLARQDSNWNYHMRSMIEAMGFKDVDKRIPADPGQVLDSDEQRMALGAPLADTVARSSNMI